MSDQLEKLKEKAQQTKEYISVTDIPNEVNAILASDLTFKADKRGNEALFITLRTKDNKYIVQKYTPSTYSYLYQRILDCGGLEKLKNEYHTWIKQRAGRSINERLYPQPKQKREK
jgi:frataxin-like iron-binding protein CyaY